MVFASMPLIWLFLPITLGLYYLIGFFRKHKIQNFMLLSLSLIFYAFSGPKYIILLCICVFVNYAGGIMIDEFDNEANMAAKKTALALTIIISLSFLAYFKYANFTVNNIQRLLVKTGHSPLNWKEVVLPVGISFYTFQALSYSIDLYRGRCKVQRSFGKLLLYVSFFPQLIAGPIVRYCDIAEQIDDRTVSIEKFSYGTSRFIVGLGKKVILANTFAKTADVIFAISSSERTLPAAWLGIIMYTLQIYFDFSGYSDMAIGMGRMFGFDFLENFKLPYIASSITEFWRRWHISLSTWFREYVYIPLGGNRKGNVRTYINLIIVFFVTGLWHGAGWTFIVWGLFHGAFMLIERMGFKSVLDKNVERGGLYRILNHIYTILVVMIAWVFFRADNLTEALKYIGNMFSGSLISETYSIMELAGNRTIVLGLLGIILSGFIPENVLEKIAGSWFFKCIILPIIFIACIMILATDNYNPFIYFRF